MLYRFPAQYISKIIIDFIEKNYKGKVRFYLDDIIIHNNDKKNENYLKIDFSIHNNLFRKEAVLKDFKIEIIDLLKNKNIFNPVIFRLNDMEIQKEIKIQNGKYFKFTMDKIKINNLILKKSKIFFLFKCNNKILKYKLGYIKSNKIKKKIYSYPNFNFYEEQLFEYYDGYK